MIFQFAHSHMCDNQLLLIEMTIISVFSFAKSDSFDSSKKRNISHSKKSILNSSA